MNRKEFTNLLLEWRENFINERGLPHEKLGKFEGIIKFSELVKKNPSIIPIEFVTFKFDKEQRPELEEIITRHSAVGDNREAVLDNTTENRQVIAKDLKVANLIDEIKSDQILNSTDTDIVIMPEVGDISSEINKDAIGNTIWSIHDLYHVYLEGKLLNKYKFDHDHNDMTLFCEFVMQALSTEDYPHFFDAVDSTPSVFAFLYLFIMEFNSQTNEFDIDKSNENIDKLKVDLQNFDLSNYLKKDEYPDDLEKETIVNVDSLIDTIKKVNKSFCETLQQKIFKEDKEIILTFIS